MTAIIRCNRPSEWGCKITPLEGSMYVLYKQNRRTTAKPVESGRRMFYEYSNTRSKILGKTVSHKPRTLLAI